jgi:hypothetical protein
VPTSFPMSIPHAPTGFVNQAALDTAFSTPINDLYAVAAAAGQGFIGDSAAGAAVTLSTTSAFASTTTVTFTLTSTRRVRIMGTIGVQANTAPGHYSIRAGYNSGSSAVIGSFIGVGGSGFLLTTTTAGGNGAVSGMHEGTVLLTAGTYTAYISITRVTLYAYDGASPFDLAAAKAHGAVLITGYIVGHPGGMDPITPQRVRQIHALGMGFLPNWERAADFFRTASLADCRNAGKEALAACRALGVPDDGTIGVRSASTIRCPPPGSRARPTNWRRAATAWAATTSRSGTGRST